MIKIGCCGFPVNSRNYYENFSIVEIQKTFYTFPQLKTVKKWRAVAPSDFEFCLKASQLITHLPSSPTYRKLGTPLTEMEKRNYGFFKPTREVFVAWKRIKRIAELLKSKTVLFQMPASFKPVKENKDNMKTFFKNIKRKNLTLLWEARGTDWKEEEIRKVCQDNGLIHVVDPLKDRQVWGDIKYFRLHGIGGYRYKYTQKDLRFLLSCIPHKCDTYCLFNNVYMFEDALEFKKLIG